ncbi:GntR family transcriptional regulator [Alicyclobacillus cycloheptanicus]|uniref:DNA-binding GntR family transcriptional regulator n=1 Tax=Alicyclobacillus cycloheptanicus TaxID=1457 RepID=A0ABT9XIK4_9BACL|nr:GntR family transcriptional regulator [Alicyclobacillus cycloheptanicus]MDQ0189541.1 DNA-binding GntR family transcriptional regulator [Alicyclobacillus cycloheptanicus]WDM01597.1 GntR family transcriptional regulator [Alicyclobacillus cycloheptanicus]
MSDDWKVEDEPLSDKVTNMLRKLIVNQTFKPGDRLVQEELASRMGVSRMPIRDAFKRLAYEGLVVIEPRKGAVVAPVSRESFQEVYTLRMQLEPMANRLSAENLNIEDLGGLKSLCDQMEKCVAENDTYLFSQLNGSFHKLLRSKCQWRRLIHFVETLWDGLPPYTPTFIQGQAEQSQAEHRQILEAIQAREFASVETISRRHIERSRDLLLDRLEQLGYFVNHSGS